METDQLKHDVAISFLSKDEPTGSAIHERLSEGGVKVFFYPRNQEELAGTDGMESMRKPFFDESQVVVVLYREPWGKTPWTRVEETAIKDRCLSKGWASLVFITLDKTSTLPVWLPQAHVRYNFEDYGLEQAVGAIKSRVQECGGVIAPVSALTRAKQFKQEAEYLAEKTRLFRSWEWIQGTVHPAINDLFSEIVRLCKQVEAEVGISITAGADQKKCVLRTDCISIIAEWSQRYVNDLNTGGLIVTEFGGHIALPNERLMYVVDRPPKLREFCFKPELSKSRNLCWVDKAKPVEFLSTTALADKCVQIFLDLLGRANRGKINFNRFTSKKNEDNDW